MYDIYDDELKEMYESKEDAGITLDQGISPNDPISSLSQEKFIVLNEQETLREAIDNIQKYHIGCILLENEEHQGILSYNLRHILFPSYDAFPQCFVQYPFR